MGLQSGCSISVPDWMPEATLVVGNLPRLDLEALFKFSETHQEDSKALWSQSNYFFNFFQPDTFNLIVKLAQTDSVAML